MAALIPSTTRYTPNELSLLLLPRQIDPTKRAFIYDHGAGGSAAELCWPWLPSIAEVMWDLARDHVVLAGNFGGPNTFGNDTEAAAMEGAWLGYLKDSGLCLPDKMVMVGASMGMESMCRFAADHPGEVAGILSLIGAPDVEGLRTANPWGSIRDLINTAWGLPLGSTDATDPVPLRGRAMDRAAEIAAIPTHLWYSDLDTAATSAMQHAYSAARSNVTEHLMSPGGDHGEAAFTGMDKAEFLSIARALTNS